MQGLAKVWRQKALRSRDEELLNPIWRSELAEPLNVLFCFDLRDEISPYLRNSLNRKLTGNRKGRACTLSEAVPCTAA